MAPLLIAVLVLFTAQQLRPTLLVGPEQQGAVAGMITATTGATFIVGPVLGAALYQLAPVAPVIAGAVACTAATALAYLTPQPDRTGASA